jgi:acyl-CoA reductase-like NAD-dependent aldehyde dehydrogenase
MMNVSMPMSETGKSDTDPGNEVGGHTVGHGQSPMVRASTARDVSAAVSAAESAFAHWAATPASERRDLLYDAAAVVESRVDEFADAMASETGGTRAWAAANVKVAAGNMRLAAGMAQLPIGDLLSTDRAGEWSLAVRQPVGVVAAITPWNAPLILSVRGVVVPLAVGNTVVLRPSEEAPITSGLFLAEALRDAGLPDGVLNVVVNELPDAPQVIEALIADPRVRRVNFTGSTRVGRIIGALAGKHLKPALLELGGKNPAIVCEDADIEQAASAIAYARFMNSGQICLSIDRVILHTSIAQRFTEELVERVSGLAGGSGGEAGPILAPLVNQRAVDRVTGLVADAVARGAKLVAGGTQANGRFFPPTVLADVTPEMRIYHEEAFGPVACLFTVPDDEAAITLANDTEYGLTSAVFTGDGARGLAMGRRLLHGCTHINSHTIKEDAEAPIGGIKDSGYGSFGGRYGLEFFTQNRWITVPEQALPTARGSVSWPR